MRNALAAAARLKLTVVQHAEDTRVTAGCSMNYGPTSFRLGVHGMPNSAESSVVERDIALARETKGHVHVAHLSTREALEAVRAAKKAKLRVTAEVTPHHFTLVDENVGEFDTHYKMNPPLRSIADRDALIEGILDGTIDAIATDHAPHAFHEKQVEFERAAFGITGLETALPIVLTVLHHHFKLPLWRIVELLSANPAKIFGLAGRGTLAKGAHADITIFDPKKKWTFDASQSLSKSKKHAVRRMEFYRAGRGDDCGRESGSRRVRIHRRRQAQLRSRIPTAHGSALIPNVILKRRFPPTS